MLEINGRKGLKVYFKIDNPEHYLADRCLYGLSDEELKEALKKPFIVLIDLEIGIEFENKYYYFCIPKGYCWNGANVPPCAWLLIGQQKEPRFKLASCVHDFLCENHAVINNNRYLSTLIFETLCKEFGRFNKLKCFLMFHTVDNFQKIFGKDLEGNKWQK